MKRKRKITKEQVNYIIEKYKIRLGPFTIDEDGLLIVDGNVKIYNTKLTRLPFRFKYVYGNFIICSNKLTTLQGSPIFVAGDFNCCDNNLTSLRYAPKEVFSFQCHENQLTSLKGLPKLIPGDFLCTFNKLTNLVGVSKEIGGVFAFDATTSLYMGDQDCKVHRIEIAQDRISESENVLPRVIIDNKKYLPIVFRYMLLLNDLFYPELERGFDESHFNDLILDIKDGFC